eukprot:Selendium_serpulae@DN2007_c0_g2_i1.p1
MSHVAAPARRVAVDSALLAEVKAERQAASSVGGARLGLLIGTQQKTEEIVVRHWVPVLPQCEDDDGDGGAARESSSITDWLAGAFPTDISWSASLCELSVSLTESLPGGLSVVGLGLLDAPWSAIEPLCATPRAAPQPKAALLKTTLDLAWVASRTRRLTEYLRHGALADRQSGEGLTDSQSGGGAVVPWVVLRLSEEPQQKQV